MKIKINWVGETFPDCSQHFDVIFGKKLTVKKFVKWVLKRKDEWGSIDVSSYYSPIQLIGKGQPFIKFSHGKKTAIDPEIYEVIKDLPIQKIEGSGGYTEMTYYLSFAPEDKQAVFDIVKKVRYEEIEECKKNKKSFPTLHYN